MYLPTIITLVAGVEAVEIQWNVEVITLVAYMESFCHLKHSSLYVNICGCINKINYCKS